tara:strand:+ start:139 stop:759 length:621 start_codon:yes stop_codon:yes gene_type:complete
MINNKGAMFGLDARIALAIFGALSVISGAALYSAIRTSKTEQYRQFFVEWLKATEQYYLDNGKQLPDYNANRPNTTDIFVNRENLDTWRGPYLGVDINVANGTGGHIKQAGITPGSESLWITTFYYNESAWTGKDEYCTSGSSDCREWLHVYADNASRSAFLINIAENLDELVDNSDGGLKGKVRYFDESPNKVYLYYMGLPRKKV